MEELTLSATKWREQDPKPTTLSVVEDYPHFLPVFTGLSSKDRGYRGFQRITIVGNWVNRGAPTPSRNFLVLYVSSSHTPLNLVRQTATSAIIRDLPGEGGAGHDE